MLDRYWHGNTSRISPEAPVPVVHVQDDEWRAGGAGNVALNIAALGGKVSLLGYTGDDEAADLLKKLMKEAGVLCQFEVLENLASITKIRVMSRHQQLIRLDFEDGFYGQDNGSLLHQYHAELEQAQVVILSDYGKGTLNDTQSFIQLANQYKKPVLVDPKGSDFRPYRGATLITPNMKEFEAVVGTCQDEAALVEKGMNLIESIQLTALLITQGEQGMTLLSRDQAPIHLPTHAREVFDVTGAGDSVISVMAASLAARQSLADSIVLANMGAGIVVAKLGTATVSRDELKTAFKHPAQDCGIGSLESILKAVNYAKKEAEKIVLTNGCFDILHPGHVQYLQQAKELGDRLIVLVNSDESVRQLKGEDRPINSLDDRMKMLAALECVDWVLAFHNDTPEQEINQLLPDILVKGGDYTDISQIAGHKSVLENGGEVRLLSFLEGHSTTSIINTIQKSEE